MVIRPSPVGQQKYLHEKLIGQKEKHGSLAGLNLIFFFCEYV
jgi:hypothetical protein